MMEFQPIHEKKCWGEVLHVFSSPNAAVSCLNVNWGWRCSIHKHVERANSFAVIGGVLAVEDWPEGRDQPSRVRIVQPGETVTVPSGIWHRFRVIASGQVIEVYWPDTGGTVRMDDIEREDVGGRDDEKELVRISQGMVEWL